MSVEIVDLEEVLVPSVQELARRFRIAATSLEGEAYMNAQFEIIGRLNEISRLSLNYAESLLREEV